jgi:hypothetical protein
MEKKEKKGKKEDKREKKGSATFSPKKNATL